MLVSTGVPDTAGYFAKELDLFDTTVCVLQTSLLQELTYENPLLLCQTFEGLFFI